jgi:hypothetical protein
MKRLSILALAIAMVASAVAVADSAASAPLTIEELYLESEISLEVIESQLATDSIQLQTLALAALEDQVLSGSVDPDSESYVEIVSTTVAQGVTIISNNRYRLPDSYHPRVRMQAARLLGYSSAPVAQNALLTVLKADPEPAVKAQAMHALAQIGTDPEQKVSFTIGKTLRHETLRMHDEALVYAALAAVQQIGSNVGMRTLHPLVRDSALKIVNGSFNRILREKAMQVLVLL